MKLKFPSKNIVQKLSTYGCQFADVIIRGSQRRKSNFLWKLRKRGIRQQRHVSEKLVAAVRLRRVERIWRMSDILRAMKNSKR